MPSDGLLGPTPTSGAAIDEQAANASLIILDRNYPNGLLQFSTAPLSEILNSSMIPPSSGKPQVVQKIAKESEFRYVHHERFLKLHFSLASI